MQLMIFFTGKKNCVSLSRCLDFCFPLIYKLRNLWRHRNRYCIQENTLFIVSLESYLVSRWNLVKCSYNFQRTFPTLSLILKTGTYFQALFKFQTSCNYSTTFIMSFTFLVLLKVCTVAIKIVNHQQLKMNWRHDINSFWKS